MKEMSRLILKFIFSKYFAWILCTGLISLLYYNYSNPKIKEVLIQPEDVTQIDSCTYQATVESVTKDTYNKMHDSLITKIKDLQSKLKIKTKDIHTAAGINASTSDSVVGHLTMPETSDTVLKPLSDSLVIDYNDPWTYIHAEGRLSKPDSILINYKVNSNLSIITHTSYKPAKTALGRWWNRLWRRGKHETYTVEAENPNLQIKQLEVIKLSEK